MNQAYKFVQYQDFLDYLTNPQQKQDIREHFFDIFKHYLFKNNYPIVSSLLEEFKILFFPGELRTTVAMSYIHDLFEMTAEHPHYKQYFALLFKKGYVPFYGDYRIKKHEDDLFSRLFESEKHEQLLHLITEYNYPRSSGHEYHCLYNICYYKNPEKLEKFFEYGINFIFPENIFLQNMSNDNIDNFLIMYEKLKQHSVYGKSDYFNQPERIQKNMLSIIYKNDLSYDNYMKIAQALKIEEVSSQAFINKYQDKTIQGIRVYQNASLSYMFTMDKIDTLFALGFEKNFLSADVEFNGAFHRLFLQNLLSSDYQPQDILKYKRLNFSKKDNIVFSDIVHDVFYYISKHKHDMSRVYQNLCLYFNKDILTPEDISLVNNDFRFKRTTPENQQAFNHYCEKIELSRTIMLDAPGKSLKAKRL